MKILCDKCNKYLGDYLYGKGGVSEKHFVGPLRKIGLPDVLCQECGQEKIESNKKMIKFLTNQ